MRGLGKAVRRGQLEVDYQPTADMRSGRIRGVEALVRWPHPRRGRLQPNDFVPAAERSPRILRRLTEVVLETAIRQARAWQLEGARLSVAINLSPRTASDPALVDLVAGTLSKWDVPPSLLELEITETAVFDPDSPRGVQAVLQELGDMGVSVALDDFGTGYSSLSRLRRLPIRVVKIDRSFVCHMDESPHDAQIVRSVIALAANLGLEVVAEGVEREVLWHRLAELGCDVAQGHYLSAPMPAADVLPWVRQWEELYGEARRMAQELTERRLGPNERRSGLMDRRIQLQSGPRFVRPEVESRDPR